jgi:uncharacterized protein with ParB-like and HNH nuclease domain/predicted transport protein
MKAQDLALFNLLGGAKQFVVPIFQRTYDWGTSNCEQLLKDILRVGGSDAFSSHFLGSVVYIAEEDINASIPRWMLIDGQQRLATLTLLLIAFRRSLRNLQEPSIGVTVEEINDYYLKNRHGKGDKRHKLRLTQSDRETLAALLDEGTLPDDSSEKLLENIEFFTERLSQENLATVYAGFRKLMIVDVSLTRSQDDPQMIFESMNSTGLDLSQADLIRNFVLMRQTDEEQTRLYNKFWHPMEKDFGGLYRKEFDTFVRDFLTVRMRLKRPVKADQIYHEFKEFCYACKTEGRSIAEILADMCQLAKYFLRFSLLREEDVELRAVFTNLRQLTDAATPLVLSLYERYTDEKLTRDEFIDIISTMESYLFRRTVCDLPSQSLPQIVATLNNSLRDDQLVDSVKVMLHRFAKRRRFPSDVEFREALLSRDIYSMKSRRVLLDRLENDSKEKIETSGFTIEHVLPQTKNLNAKWRAALGDNWQAEHEAYVHRLGNLTLTGYNEKYSDHWFGEKKAIDKGFDESPLRLNKFIREQTTWNTDLIQKRGQQMAEHASRLWGALVVNEEVVRQFELDEAIQVASEFAVEHVKGLGNDQRGLLELLGTRIKGLGEDVVELFSPKNVTYRVFDFFAQVIPRSQRLVVLLNVDFDEVNDGTAFCQDTSRKSFIANSTEKGGVLIRIDKEDDVDRAMPFVQLAYENNTD